MENGKQSAHPINDDTTIGQMGLTKREYFAVNVMQGLMSNPDSDKYNLGNGLMSNTAENKAKFCIIIADELLKQLDNK